LASAGLFGRPGGEPVGDRLLSDVGLLGWHSLVAALGANYRLLRHAGQVQTRRLRCLYQAPHDAGLRILIETLFDAVIVGQVVGVVAPKDGVGDVVGELDVA